jgi:hypothetical protein
MLIELSSVQSLDASARARMIASAQNLLHTNEAQRGHVFFEGKYYSTSAVQSLLTARAPQFLSEG